MVGSSDLSHRFEAESVGRALELVGERWTLLILREAFFGVRRFGQFARNLNIPRPTLSSPLPVAVRGRAPPPGARPPPHPPAARSRPRAGRPGGRRRRGRRPTPRAPRGAAFRRAVPAAVTR